MSRSSIRTFLVTAKCQLQQLLHAKGTASFVIGNESADLDSITCALVYGYLESSKPQAKRNNVFILPVTNIPAKDLSLRPELIALLKHADCKPEDLITLDDLGELPMPLNKTQWTLVDHNALTGQLGERYANSTAGVIDHHEDEHKVPSSASPRIIDKSGSCNSLLVNYLRSIWDDLSSLSTSVGAANAQSSDGVIDDLAYTSTWDAQVAKLALGSILIDTHNLTDESKTTEHDRKAVRYLEARINISPKYGKDYDRKKFFDGISTAKIDLDGLSLYDILRKDYKQWMEGDLTLGMSTVVKPLSYLQTKASSGDWFNQQLQQFARSRKLGIFALMTAYTNDSGDFARELLLLTTTEEGKEAAERFEKRASEELQLQESRNSFTSPEAMQRDASEGTLLKVWNQGNVAASRKRVGPLLRDAMR